MPAQKNRTPFCLYFFKENFYEQQNKVRYKMTNSVNLNKIEDKDESLN